MNLIIAKNNIRSFFSDESLSSKELKESTSFIIKNSIDKKFSKGFVVIKI